MWEQDGSDRECGGAKRNGFRCFVKTQTSHVPRSECVLASLESGPCQTADTQVLFCSCGIKHQALHGSSPLGIAMKRRCLLLNIAATATSAVPNGLFSLSSCSHYPKFTGGVGHLQPPWHLPSLNTWWVRPGETRCWRPHLSPRGLVVSRPGEWGVCGLEVRQRNPRVCHRAVVGFDASGGHWSPQKGSGGWGGHPLTDY